MYTYEYERIYTKGIGGSKTIGYQEIITARARNGWRYVGLIPVVQKGYGFITEMDLVFEKEVAE